MNTQLPTKSQLPAYLQAVATNPQFVAVNEAAAAGISGGGWPRISIKGARFRLQSPQDEEFVVPTMDLDVIVIEANPHGLQKIYYPGVYDPNTEPTAPTCFSDNGIGPSIRSTKPQSQVCATCPHNVWGSKILPSGAKSKVCSDYKKLAVILAANPTGPVFELRLPAGSLTNWASYVDQFSRRGEPVCYVVTKLAFDTNADYPKLVFSSPGYINPEQLAAIQEVIGTEEVDQCTGKNDKPIDGTKALPAPLPAATAANLNAAQTLGNFASSVAAAMPPGNPGVGPTPPPSPNYPHYSGGVDVNARTAAQPPAKRARRTKEQMAAQPSAAPQMPPAAPAPIGNSGGRAEMPPAFLNRPRANAAHTVAPLSAPVTNSQLDDVIANVMKV